MSINIYVLNEQLKQVCQDLDITTPTKEDYVKIISKMADNAFTYGTSDTEYAECFFQNYNQLLDIMYKRPYPWWDNYESDSSLEMPDAGDSYYAF